MGRVVCVSGASGYVASWVVKFLLDRGYTVKATLRNLNDPSRFAHLKALEGAEERLQSYQANLVEDGSFDHVIDGCDGVFHTASPVLLSNTTVTDPQTELIQPAVEGTLNVLRSCSKAASVKRVNWYCLSKTLAEAAAWKYAEENGINLLCINPGLVLGPLLQPTLNATSALFVELLKGNDVLPYYLLVDVRILSTRRRSRCCSCTYSGVRKSFGCWKIYFSWNEDKSFSGSAYIA